jgi:hypothetical protein
MLSVPFNEIGVSSLKSPFSNAMLNAVLLCFLRILTHLVRKKQDIHKELGEQKGKFSTKQTVSEIGIAASFKFLSMKIDSALSHAIKMIALVRSLV